jgi:hypothetical protein
MLIAVVAASALTLCLTPVGIRATGIYAYACLGCGFVGAVISDWVARFAHNVAHTPDWVGYVASFAVFFIANIIFFFLLLCLISATIQLISRAISRKRRQLL